MSDPIRIGILGASGYTGAELVRLLAGHPDAQIRVLTANQQAGQPMHAVYPHLRSMDLPDLVTWEEADWSALDVAFCALPHGTSQAIVAQMPAGLKVVDLSADFRLRDVDTYAAWYGKAHQAPERQRDAVYGLTELNRTAIGHAGLVACPGCYPTAALLALSPLLDAGTVEPGDLIIDAKSGVTGAGRKVTQGLLFAEVGEGIHPYGVGKHRHAPEMEQELSLAAGADVRVNFTPHLIPMNRGELVTCHVRLAGDATAGDVRRVLGERYDAEPFVRVLPEGATPATRNVRGSNMAEIGVFPDRLPGRAVVVAAIDNLAKGSSGQAIQNMNVMLALHETRGLELQPMFP
ncbi:N-acetyl-gamma-glutamyl-phosphate reductase [Limimonas halophila]|uniref:N-acetyl-gamma-glutamyl-phosphate reductase n=1 Tax=Limimonas halophila TaxID=1082479 RepID=A0A1G7NPE7_9PROT|nr:N-acetyl-gamma-glutamyl-phosphate reductase [Limimonas halophila]SDF75856.1 N-acetyl-gamma-glutamyl-phosphate reductase [Limimonas halophila]